MQFTKKVLAAKTADTLYKNKNDTIRVLISLVEDDEDPSSSGWDFRVFYKNTGDEKNYSIKDTETFVQTGATDYFKTRLSAKKEAETIYGPLKPMGYTSGATDGW